MVTTHSISTRRLEFWVESMNLPALPMAFQVVGSTRLRGTPVVVMTIGTVTVRATHADHEGGRPPFKLLRALGYAMLAKSGDKGSFLTAHLAVDYAGSARTGDWITRRR